MPARSPKSPIPDPTRRRRAVALMLALALPGAACTQEEEAPAASTRNHLLWKRFHAVEQDLAYAMKLEPGEVCLELGEHSCVQRVHLTSLGGHDPFEQGLYQPVDSPLVTTPLALERVATSACGARVSLDREGPAEVFEDIDLEGDAPAADSQAFRKTVRRLYRRLLARDPVDAEYEVLADLLVGEDGSPVPAHEFAASACVAIATTTEFLFF